MHRWIAVALTLWCPSQALAQPGLAGSLEAPRPGPAEISPALFDAAPEWPEPRRGAPGGERFLLYLAGSGAAGAGTAVVALGALGVGEAECGGACDGGPDAAAIFSGFAAGLGLFPSLALVASHAAGRPGDPGWTFLGTVIGALPGLALATIGWALQESGGSWGRLILGYSAGPSVGGAGMLLGSILACNLSARADRAEPPPIEVGVGPGSLALTVRTP